MSLIFENVVNGFLEKVSTECSIPISSIQKIWDENIYKFDLYINEGINNDIDMKKTKIEKFLELGCFDGKKTRFVCVDEFVGPYADLKFSNGGDWCRIDGTFGKKYKACILKSNNTKELYWTPTDEEEKEIEYDISLLDKKKSSGNSIYMIKVYGVQDKSFSKTIRADIRRKVLEKPVCVGCGCVNSKSIEIDHKNGLYNNPRVNNTTTQNIQDFQPLCRHCNDVKRQTIKDMKKTHKRYPATNIPHLKTYGIDFIEGDETYNPDDVNAMVGTYWYDPIKFHECIKYRHDEEIKRLKKQIKLISNK